MCLYVDRSSLYNLFETLEESRVKLWHFAILISSLNLIHERMQPRPNPVCFQGGGDILTVRNFDSWLPFCRLVCFGCICIYHNPISKCYRCIMGTKFFVVRKQDEKENVSGPLPSIFFSGLAHHGLHPIVQHVPGKKEKNPAYIYATEFAYAVCMICVYVCCEFLYHTLCQICKILNQMWTNKSSSFWLARTWA